MIVSHPANPSYLVQACGLMAPFASLVVFLAPMPTIRHVTHSKSIGNMPLLPYSSMVASTLVWTTYGVLKRETKVWASNGVGLLLALFYCWEFVKYAPKKIPSPTLPGTVLQHVQACIMVLLTTLALVMFYPKKAATRYIGSLGVVLCVAMFASPLAAVKTVLELRSAKSIPLPFTVAAMLNCFLWSVVGWFEMKDLNIYAPNLLGLSFGVAQLALKLRFGNGDTNSGVGSVDLPI